VPSVCWNCTSSATVSSTAQANSTDIASNAASSQTSSILSFSPATPAPAASGTPSSSVSQQTLNTGAIAGIAIGVVALIALLLALASYFLRRRRQSYRGIRGSPVKRGELDGNPVSKIRTFLSEKDGKQIPAEKDGMPVMKLKSASVPVEIG
jgi:LPXTG-motif cell wall-anchored protein